MSPGPGGAGIPFRATGLADLSALAALLADACARVGAGDEASADLRLAAEEVFTNIFRHGYRSGTGPVTVRVDATPARVVVTLADAAPDFDPASARAPDIDAGLGQREPGGLGWHLVRQVMDEVKREPGADGGNVYTLVRNLPPRGGSDG